MISQKPYGTFNPPDTHLVDRLRYWVRQQPDEVAFYLYDGEEDVQRLTYRQLDQQARKIASELFAIDQRKLAKSPSWRPPTLRMPTVPRSLGRMATKQP